MQQYQTFNGTLNMLRSQARRQNVTIEDSDIIAALEISAADFHHYRETDTAPDALFQKLRAAYPQYLRVIVENIQFTSEFRDPMDKEEKE